VEEEDDEEGAQEEEHENQLHSETHTHTHPYLLPHASTRTCTRERAIFLFSHRCPCLQLDTSTVPYTWVPALQLSWLNEALTHSCFF
jgi:hypothetical protein